MKLVKPFASVPFPVYVFAVLLVGGILGGQYLIDTRVNNKPEVVTVTKEVVVTPHVTATPSATVTPTPTKTLRRVTTKPSATMTP